MHVRDHTTNSDVGDARAEAGHEAEAWAARAPQVHQRWFVRPPSSWHGVSHTQRVYLHVERLGAQLGWSPAELRAPLSAALWHDIGRETDGRQPEHAARSAARAQARRLHDGLSDTEAELALFAIINHCLPDAEGAAAARLARDPGSALRVLHLLKDADALDRVRLGLGEGQDPAQLRHPPSVLAVPFARQLLAVLP